VKSILGPNGDVYCIPYMAPQILHIKRTDRKDTDLMNMFRKWDRNGDGQLDKTEMKSVLSITGTSEAEIDRLFAEADLDNSGHVDIEEFFRWLYRSAPDVVRKAPSLVNGGFSALLAQVDGTVDTSLTCFSSLLRWEDDFPTDNPKTLFERPTPNFIFAICSKLCKLAGGAFLGAELRGVQDWNILDEAGKIRFFNSVVEFAAEKVGVSVDVSGAELLQSKNVEGANQLLQVLGLRCSELVAQALAPDVHSELPAEHPVQLLRQSFIEFVRENGCSAEELFQLAELGLENDTQDARLRFLNKLFDFVVAVADVDPRGLNFSADGLLGGEMAGADALRELLAKSARSSALKTHWRLAKTVALLKQELREKG